MSATKSASKPKKQPVEADTVAITVQVPANAKVVRRLFFNELRRLEEKEQLIRPGSPLYPTGDVAASLVELMQGPISGEFSKSVMAGFAVLACFGLDEVITEERTMLSIKEIAEILGMSESTAHRYVKTHTQVLGLLVQDPKTRMYMLAS
jgi:AraC-like DNA-binding protein